MSSILDSIQQQVQQQVSSTAVQQVSQRFGIDPVVAQRAVNAAIPLITAAVAAHANSGGADTVHREAAAQAENPQRPAPLPQVLGDHHDAVTQRVSDVTGISRDDASKIVNAVAPAVLGGIGQHVQEQGIDSGQLASDLSTAITGARPQPAAPGNSREATL
ncbi:MAG: hypothetical protein QOD47_1828 [Gemmatimonadaceae bacterium]|jgi:hypothetical protein|nr:hypothetical protein [Gemmatimonadaceae bacterium]